VNCSIWKPSLSFSSSSSLAFTDFLQKSASIRGSVAYRRARHSIQSLGLSLEHCSCGQPASYEWGYFSEQLCHSSERPNQPARIPTL
ncbi:hypothetical protein DBR06_SOUSAS3410019, partial [Sousa chinensis]